MSAAMEDNGRVFTLENLPKTFPTLMSASSLGGEKSYVPIFVCVLLLLLFVICFCSYLAVSGG